MGSYKYLDQWLLQKFCGHGLKGLWSAGEDFSRSGACELIVFPEAMGSSGIFRNCFAQ